MNHYLIKNGSYEPLPYKKKITYKKKQKKLFTFIDFTLYFYPG